MKLQAMRVQACGEPESTQEHDGAMLTCLRPNEKFVNVSAVRPKT